MKETILGVGAVILITILPVVFVVVVGVVAIRRYRSFLELLATRCHGVLAWDGGSAQLCFRWGRLPVVVEITSGKTNLVEIRLPWASRRWRCEIRPAGLMRRIGRFLRAPDAVTGSRWFDSKYVIRTTDIGELRQFLSPDAQLHIESLRLCDALPTVHLAVSHGKLVIKRPLQDYRNLEALIGLVLRLYSEAIQGTLGVVFLNARSARLRPAKGRCRVCGESLRDRPELRGPAIRKVVCCARCKSPHHRECWEYCGGCSTYGCGETTCSAAGHSGH